MKHQLCSERGMALIHVGVALLALMGLSAIVLDFGVLWLARGQAQNAADAGALAGVTALAFTDYNDRSDSGAAHQAAITAASANKIAGVAGGVTAQQAKDATTWGGPTAPATCVSNPGSCVQANVYRDGSNGSTRLPTYFATLFGITAQDIKATATAQMLGANEVAKCLKPWIVPDRFSGPDWPNNPYKAGTDTYIPPSQPNTTGYTRADLNTKVTLRLADYTTPSQYQRADLTGGGDVAYRNNITGCADKPFQIGDPITTETGKGSVPQQNQVMADFFAQDPNARWNNGTITGSCADTGSCACSTDNGGTGCANGMNGRISPLVVPVAVVDPGSAVIQTPGQQTTTILNLLAFFIDPTLYQSDGTIGAWITTYPADISPAAPTVPLNNTTIVFLSLVR